MELGDDQAERVHVRGSEAEVVISNRTFGYPAPAVTDRPRELGRIGPRGVCSVVEVSTSLIRLDPVAEIAPGVIGISGSVIDRYDAAPRMEADVFDWAGAGAVAGIGPV